MITVKLDSKIFDKTQRRAAIASAVSKTAKSFKDSTKRKMVEQRASGKTYDKKVRGRSFVRRHRASARGQRPQPDTLNLVNAVTDKRSSEFTSEVFIDHRINPENGADAQEYAERLQNSMNRPIMSEQDARIGEIELKYRCEKALKELE